MRIFSKTVAGKGLFDMPGLAACVLLAVVTPAAGAATSLSEVEVSLPRAEMITGEITRRLAPARDALEAALVREADLKDFAVWERVAGLEEWLAGIRELKQAGDIAAAYDRAFSISTTWQTDRVTEVAEALPFMLLGPVRRRYAPGAPRAARRRSEPRRPKGFAGVPAGAAWVVLREQDKGYSS